MMTINVNIEPLIAGVMEKYRAVMDDREMIHDAIRAEAEAVVKKHLLALNSRSPNTGYYAKASAGVNSRADADADKPATGTGLCAEGAGYGSGSDPPVSGMGAGATGATANRSA